MNPVQTIQAFEYLAVCRLEKLQVKGGKKLCVWLPSKDDGIDILVTNASAPRQTCGIQVKGSRDYLLTDETALPRNVKACGWWSLSAAKLKKSKADFWVFVLLSLPKAGNDKLDDNYIIIKTSELIAKLGQTYGRRSDYRMYLWITDDGRCFDTRGLKKSHKIAFAEFSQKASLSRDYSGFLEKWDQITKGLID